MSDSGRTMADQMRSMIAQTDALIDRVHTIENWTHALLSDNKFLHEENARLRSTLEGIDPAKLELLAEWLRMQDESRQGDQIQTDLCRWAGYIREAKG